MLNNAFRIIIDTNLWISFLITKDFSKLDEIVFSRKAVLLFSEELLEEFFEVSSRPKFRKYFPSDSLIEILQTIEEFAEIIKVKSKIEECRDPKDNFLLSLSVDGKADFLITGDKDLLDLKTIGKTKIVTIAEFLQDI